MKMVKYAIVIVCLLSLAGLVAVERANAYFADIEQSSGNIFQAGIGWEEPEPTPSGGGGGLGDITPPKISDISTSSISETTADVYWETDEKSTSQVEYWSSPSTLTPLDKTYTKEHLVHLADLEPGTTYFYRTISKDRNGNKEISTKQTFTTLEEVVAPEPIPPEPVEPVIVEPEPEPEPEPIIAPAPIPPITPEPVPEAPFPWVTVISSIIGGLVILGLIYWFAWRKRER